MKILNISITFFNLLGWTSTFLTPGVGIQIFIKFARSAFAKFFDFLIDLVPVWYTQGLEDFLHQFEPCQFLSSSKLSHFCVSDLVDCVFDGNRAICPKKLTILLFTMSDHGCWRIFYLNICCLSFWGTWYLVSLSIMIIIIIVNWRIMVDIKDQCQDYRWEIVHSTLVLHLFILY